MSEFLLTEGVAKAYGLYALSVIKGRALPDIRDGLKPVQRRILYAMYEGGYKYNKPSKKSVRIVGEVLGKYHPHGDSSVYGALVNLAQDFDMSLPLIQGQGNFGSIDGDKAASMRYTEARLAHVSEYLLQDYDKETVLFKPNYDETLEMPTVLPVQFPNILVNGASGIAVGMATSIPPHNLGEVLDACVALLENENLELHELMQYIKGPDFPTGGAFYGGQHLIDGYKTGRGKVILRGSCFEEENKGRTSLIIDSIPYQVSKPKLIENIANFIENGFLEDISDLRDESGKKIRVVLELKKDANVEIIKQRLFAKTNLQISISFNMVAIKDDRPIVFGLIQALKIFLQFREEVVIKRAEFILGKTIAKTHLLSALILATRMLDKVIATIRGSDDSSQAFEKLAAIEWKRDQYQPILDILGEDYITTESYYLSNLQIKAILELRLQKLTKLEQNELLNDLIDLGKIISEQKRIIQDHAYRKELMKQEFLLIKEKFAVPRRTNVMARLDNLNEESLIEKEEIVIMLTASGYIKRCNIEEYRVQNRGGKGKIGHKKLEDPIKNIFTTNTLAEILFFTSNGKVFSMKAYEIPEGSANSRGRAAVNLFQLDEGEKITTILPMPNEVSNETSNETFNDENIEEVSEDKLENEQEIVRKIVEDEDHEEDDEIKGKEFVTLSYKEPNSLVFITTNGTIRRNSIKDFSNIRANGKIAMKLSEGNSLHSVLLTSENDELLLTSSKANSIRFAVSDVRIFESRSSEGIRAIRLNEDDNIIDATRIDSSFNAEILCVTENGYGKRSKLDEYRKIKRGGKGSKSMNINPKTGKLVQVLAVDTMNDVLLMTKNGQTIRMNISDIRKTARVASGVILMRMPKGDNITLAMSILAEEE